MLLPRSFSAMPDWLGVQADIFSLGVLLWEMFTNKVPSSRQDIMKDIEERRPVTTDSDSLAIIGIIEKCLGKPEERPTAVQVHDCIASRQVSQTMYRLEVLSDDTAAIESPCSLVQPRKGVSGVERGGECSSPTVMGRDRFRGQQRQGQRRGHST